MQPHPGGPTEPGCMDSPWVSGGVILVIFFDMVLLALEADQSARYGLHAVPDVLVWANRVVVGVFALEMVCRLRGCQCRDVFLVVDLVVICTQFVDVVLSAVARLAAGSEAHAYLLIAQYARSFRIVRCLRVIPCFASTKAGAFLDLKKLFSVPFVICVLM